MGRVARRDISVVHGLDWWPLEDKNEVGNTVVYSVMDQALEEQDVFANSYEKFLPSPQTVSEEQNQSKKGDNMKVLTDKSPTQVKDKAAKAPLSYHSHAQGASSHIHILGDGGFGKFVAHVLGGIGDPPSITILSKRGDLVRQLDDKGKMLEMVAESASHRRPGADNSHIYMSQPRIDKSQHVIDKLIVTVKANHIVPALLSVKESLRPSSTVCFLQNCMGIIEDVNTRVFPNTAARPRYMVGMTFPEIRSEYGRASTAFAKGMESTYLSVVPHTSTVPRLEYVTGEQPMDGKPLICRMYYGWNSSSRQLMKSLSRCTLLNAKGFRYDDMLQLQFKTLAINAVLEPLSVIFDCTYRDLLETPTVSSLMRGLLDEIVSVARSVPELQTLDRFKTQFTSKRLGLLIARVALNSNRSSGPMREDVRKGLVTDIDFINGYIVKRGQELGVPCPVNTTVIQMVKAKQAMARSKNESIIPFAKM